MEFFLFWDPRSASVHKNDDLVVVQFYGTALNVQNARGLVNALESSLVALVKTEVTLDLYLAFLEQGNDGCVIVQHLELAVHAGNRHRFHFSLKYARLRRYYL